MNATTHCPPVTHRPLSQLLSQLPREAKTFVKEEVQLAKKEVSEKLSASMKNAVSLAVGGFIAYAGAIVLLAGLGVLAGMALQKLGWDPALANGVGLGAVGLIVVISGVVMLLKGLSKLKKGSLIPEKALETISPMAAVKLESARAESRADKSEDPNDSEASSEELQAEAMTSKCRLDETIEEIGDRLNPRNIRRHIEQAILARPERWAAVLAGTAMLGGFLLKRTLFRRRAY